MSDRIFVTGVGVISSIGFNLEETLSNLRNMKSGISNIQILNTKHKDDFKVGEVKRTNDELYEIAGVSKKSNVSRTTLLGIIAAKEAISKSATTTDRLRTGMISATTVGGMDRTEDFYSYFINDISSGNLRDVATHDSANSTEEIAKSTNTGNFDFISTVSSACSSSLNSIALGARLIKNNILDRAVVGGTDALSRFTLNGFNSLMILDREHCKPFDKNRQGLNLGEGAGFLVLESERTIKDCYQTIICELKSWGNACDAFHQTASSPNGHGAYLAMDNAIKSSGLELSDIHYINAHGTGTENNDLTEGKAIERIFSANIPPISSTKSYTGHALGAAGAIESVISILALRNNLIFPNLNFKDKIDDLNFVPQLDLVSTIEIKNVLTNSFGFGGNCSSLIFSKI